MAFRIPFIVDVFLVYATIKFWPREWKNSHWWESRRHYYSIFRRVSDWSVGIQDPILLVWIYFAIVYIFDEYYTATLKGEYEGTLIGDLVSCFHTHILHATSHSDPHGWVLGEGSHDLIHNRELTRLYSGCNWCLAIFMGNNLGVDISLQFADNT